MKSIAVINQKGGVGKTATTVHLGAYFSKKGLKVLLIDLDGQTDLSQSLGYFYVSPNVSDFLLRKTEENSASNFYPEPIKINSKLFLIPGFEELDKIKISRNLFGEQLKAFAPYFDICLVDCSPKMLIDSILTTNEMVLSAVDFVLIPIDVSSNSINGVQKFIGSIERVKSRYNKNLRILGIVFSKVNERKIIFKTFFSYMKNLFDDMIFDQYVRDDTKVEQATAVGQTIFDFDNKSRAASDYEELGKEILKRLKHYEK